MMKIGGGIAIVPIERDAQPAGDATRVPEEPERRRRRDRRGDDHADGDGDHRVAQCRSQLGLRPGGGEVVDPWGDRGQEIGFSWNSGSGLSAVASRIQKGNRNGIVANTTITMRTGLHRAITPTCRRRVLRPSAPTPTIGADDRQEEHDLRRGHPEEPEAERVPIDVEVDGGARVARAASRGREDPREHGDERADHEDHDPQRHDMAQAGKDHPEHAPPPRGAVQLGQLQQLRRDRAQRRPEDDHSSADRPPQEDQRDDRLHVGGLDEPETCPALEAEGFERARRTDRPGGGGTRRGCRSPLARRSPGRSRSSGTPQGTGPGRGGRRRGRSGERRRAATRRRGRTPGS